MSENSIPDPFDPPLESPFMDDDEFDGLDSNLSSSLNSSLKSNSEDSNGGSDHLRYLLTAYLFGDISAAGKVEVEEHLAVCDVCRAELEKMRETFGVIDEALKSDPLEYSFDERRRQRVMESGQRRRFRVTTRIVTNKPLMAAASFLLLAVIVGPWMLPSAVVRNRSSTARMESDYYMGQEEPMASPSSTIDFTRSADDGRASSSGLFHAPDSETVVLASKVVPTESTGLKRKNKKSTSDGKEVIIERSIDADDFILSTNGVIVFGSQVRSHRGLAQALATSPEPTSESAPMGKVEADGEGADAVSFSVTLSGNAATDAKTAQTARGLLLALPDVSAEAFESFHISGDGRVDPSAGGGAEGTNGRHGTGLLAGQPNKLDRGARRPSGTTVPSPSPADESMDIAMADSFILEESEAGDHTLHNVHTFAAGGELVAVQHDGAAPLRGQKQKAQGQRRQAQQQAAPSAPSQQQLERRQEIEFGFGDRADMPKGSDLDNLAAGPVRTRDMKKTREILDPQMVEKPVIQRKLDALELPTLSEVKELVGYKVALADAVKDFDGDYENAPVDKLAKKAEKAKGSSRLEESRELAQNLQRDFVESYAKNQIAEALRESYESLPGEDVMKRITPIGGMGGAGGAPAAGLSELARSEGAKDGNVFQGEEARKRLAPQTAGSGGGGGGATLARSKDDTVVPFQGAGGGAGGGSVRVNEDGQAPYIVDFDTDVEAPGVVPDEQSLVDSEDLLRSYKAYQQNDAQLNYWAFKTNRLSIPAPEIGDEGLGREEFRKRYGVNPFVDTRRDKVSTFAMDVDTASFTRARMQLGKSQLPPLASIRVEEFVNYFPQDYATHTEEVFSVACDGMPSPFGNEGVELLRVGIKARDLRPNERRNAVLTFVVDVSGSMSDQRRLDTVKKSINVLVDALEPTDLVAIASYADEATLILPHTPARQKERIRGVLGSMLPRGGTNVEAGLDLAYRVAHDALSPGSLNRVILVSDGVANVGARGPEEILKKVKVFARKGIYLSAVGVGMGKYNDAMLERLANEGNGNYSYVSNDAEATHIFRNNLPGTLEVLAQDAKIQVEFHAEGVTHYRLLGYENRDIADKDFRNDKVDAGEVGPGTTVTALYEIVRRPGWAGSIGTVRLRYLDTRKGQIDERDFPIPQGVVATETGAASESLRLLACAAELAELLRESYYARDGSFSDVLGEIARLDPVTQNRPETRDLAQMTAQAQVLKIQSLQQWLQALPAEQLRDTAQK
jgi:Ca-activated chloride channel family protein